jgi:thiosulfate dehydrogenase [quinone] large subunit
MMSELRERVGQTGWVLLPLRAFLAIVYLYGGISKIADSRFLDDSSPTSMHASVVAIKSTSPIGGLLGPVVDHSFAFGLLMALGELAVGIGVLLGLWTRIAAVGGMVLALSLWLTVSWGASPWFTSADLVYLFAFTPLLVAGSGGVFSVDGWLASAVVRHPGRSEDRTRRALVTGAAGVGALVVLGAASLTRRSTSSPSTKAEPDATTAGPGPASSSAASSPGASSSATLGAELVKASDVPVGGGKQITDPVSGDPTWVLQLSSGQFTAYDAVCPHQGCPVNFVSKSDGFACPCHGSHFSSTGKRESGPATRGLGSVAVQVVDGVVRRT